MSHVENSTAQVFWPNNEALDLSAAQIDPLKFRSAEIFLTKYRIAEDCTIDTFERVWQSWHTWRDRRRGIKPWLAAIARNVGRTQLAKTIGCRGAGMTGVPEAGTESRPVRRYDTVLDGVLPLSATHGGPSDEVWLQQEASLASPSVEHESLEEEQALIVRRAFQSISPECQEFVRMIVHEQRKFQEVARELGLTPRVVTYRFKGCIDKVRQALQSYFSPKE